MTEIFKTLQNEAPAFMNEIFKINEQPYNLRRTNLLKLVPCKSKTFGTYSLSFRASFIWNYLPIDIKSAATLSQFKILIKKWNGDICKCKICSISQLS